MTYSIAFLIWVGLFNLIIGSFLNVIIYRLPAMLKQKWQHQCQEYLYASQSEPRNLPNWNLLWPRSHCPQCKEPLKFYHNIPLLSFLLLRGRCFSCKKRISWQYPAVELLTTALGLIIALKFSLSWQTFALSLLMYALISLTMIDLLYGLLPDCLTLPFLWLAMIFSTWPIIFNRPSAIDAIWGAILAYISLWLINAVFKSIKKINGIGQGDFKLFSMLGAWLGWQYLPLVLLLASATGALIGLILLFSKKITRKTPIPFGPFLATAGFIIALWGPNLINLLSKGSL